MHISDAEKIKINIPFVVDIHFVADGQPQIRAACFYFSGDCPRCLKVTDVIYGSAGTGTTRVETQTNKWGSIRLECYVTYIREGKIEATNVIGTNISVPEVDMLHHMRQEERDIQQRGIFRNAEGGKRVSK